MSPSIYETILARAEENRQQHHERLATLARRHYATIEDRAPWIDPAVLGRVQSADPDLMCQPDWYRHIPHWPPTPDTNRHVNRPTEEWAFHNIRQQARDENRTPRQREALRLQEEANRLGVKKRLEWISQRMGVSIQAVSGLLKRAG